MQVDAAPLTDPEIGCGKLQLLSAAVQRYEEHQVTARAGRKRRVTCPVQQKQKLGTFQSLLRLRSPGSVSVNLKSVSCSRRPVRDRDRNQP